MVEGHEAVHEPAARPSAPARRPLSRSAPELATLARHGVGALGTPEAVLALGRAAGNRTVARALAQQSERVLARCAGPCTCGGTCGEEELVEDEVRRV